MVKLYVGGLPSTITEIQLLELFSLHALVTELNIVKEGIKSLGYGFVHLQNETAAQRVIHALDGKQIENKKISVRLAHKK